MMSLKRLTESTAEVAEDAEKASKRGRNSFSPLCALRVLGGESVLLGAVTMGSDYSTWLPADDEEEADDEDEDEEEGKDAPRLRKSLQNAILKLIHEIERLQANAGAEKGHLVHVLDSNSG